MTVTKTSVERPVGAGSLGLEVTTELLVEHVERTATDVIVLTLRTRNESSLPEWDPGAHIDVVLDETTVRQYSLCGDPANRTRWQIAIRRAPDGRGGSIRLHDTVSPGATLTVRGPRNGFPLVDDRLRYVFIAGGIGITPLLPMIAAVSRRNARWQLHYGGRTRALMPFVEDLAKYEDRVRLWPEDESGLLDLANLLAELDEGTAVYCCGPEALIAAVELLCQGRDDVTLHVERFAPRPGSADGPTGTFEVFCATSDLMLTVPPDKSILQVVQEAGIDVLSSCMEGTCGTCEVDVVDGEPDHRDSFLSPRERESNETMLICVSRCLGSKLTIDL
jgi:ferredoxin-NADP reductase